VLSGNELPALTYTPPRHFGHVDGYTVGIGHPYSPTVAAALLDASGYAGVPTITLMVNTLERNLAIAKAVRDIWYETLGISVTVEHLPWGEYKQLLREGSADERPGVWRMSWYSDFPDAHNWHGWAFGFYSPWTRYTNPDYYALVEEAAGETDSAKRLELYEQVEATMVMTDTAIAPLYYAVDYRLTRPDLDRTYRSFGQRLDEWSFAPTQRPLETGRAAPASLDPALSWDWDYLSQLFVGLTGIDNDTGAAVPELATSWQASPDATVYTFTLRSDVKWTDDTSVTAHDVEYGVLRSLDPDLNSSSNWLLYDIKNAWAYFDGSITDPDQVGVEALSDTLIRFTLERPAAYFPVIAGMPPARPQPQTTIETYGGRWTHPDYIVSNGPYELVHWDRWEVYLPVVLKRH
jgi:ABC-type oligopeptide transport system substrate-binding subunit